MTHTANRFAVAAVGEDRPGIVAAVTKALVENGCNLEDTAMSILGGHFAMMLVIDAPEGAGTANLEGTLAEPAADFNLVLMVRPMTVSSIPVASAEHERCTVSVYGADHPGIVHGVAEFLAVRAVNIVDLTTRVVGSPAEPVYAMVLEVDVPANVESQNLSRDLDELAERMGVSASVHPSEADIF